VAAITEHHITDDDQAPTIAEHLEREIDGATGSMIALRGRRGACGSNTACHMRTVLL